MPKLTSKTTDKKGQDLITKYPKDISKDSQHRFRNQVTSQFIGALSRDFNRNGVQAIEQVRKKNPQAYCHMVMHLIPKETKISGNINITNIIQDINDRVIKDIATDSIEHDTIALDSDSQDNSE